MNYTIEIETNQCMNGCYQGQWLNKNKSDKKIKHFSPHPPQSSHLYKKHSKKITTSLLFLDRQKQLKFWWQLLLTVKPIRKVDPPDSAIRVNGHPESLNVVRAVSPSSKVWQVELNLVPTCFSHKCTFVQPHRHRANERFHSSCRLVVRGSKPSADVFVVQHLDFKSEIFFQLRLKRNLTFLMIMTRKGNLMPKVYFSLAGHVI